MAQRKIFAAAIAVLASVGVLAQDNSTEKSEKVYRFNKKWELPYTIAAVGWPIYGMSKIYGRDPVPEAEVLALDVNSINKFDRPVANNYDPKAAKVSDMFFYGSMPLPLVLLFDKKVRKDAGQIGLLYLETIGTYGSIYVTSAMSANRFRPYAYNPTVDITKRTRGGARNSFFAGHPGFVASSTFFMAKVLNDYHPEWKNKWIMFSAAGAMTVTTGLLRLKAGQHFRTDVITGTTIGTLSGILIPHLHKNKNGKETRLTLSPSFDEYSNGLTALVRLGR